MNFPSLVFMTISVLFFELLLVLTSLRPKKKLRLRDRRLQHPKRLWYHHTVNGLFSQITVSELITHEEPIGTCWDITKRELNTVELYFPCLHGY